MSIYAKVIADSISPTGSRLTTVEARFHRFILAEMNTHRAFSRNTASSRAIPTKKLIEQVHNDPALPIEFGSNKPGMQAGDPVSNEDDCRMAWKYAAVDAAYVAQDLLDAGVHKQVVNRLLEPFLWTTQIITSTEAGWINFFAQRCSSLSQPEICEVATQIDWALRNSKPEHCEYGQWHLPYVGVDVAPGPDERKISAARCARVSYLTHEGVRDQKKDIELFDRLVTDGHWSPLEHVATPDYNPAVAGNFDGWAQLRHVPEYQ